MEHWVSQTKCLEPGGNPSLIYEWTNYRYAMPELNSSKGERPDLLDPYDVQAAGWFRLRLPSLEVELLTEAVPEPHRTRAEATMRRFKLADNPKIVRLRRGYLLNYQSGDVTLRFLREHDPMLAMALEELFSADEEALSVVQRGFRAKLARSRHMAGATTP
ncbi:hypothetical protein PPSIR1_37149 [Plesiocystis pacifica SIR-1]|uniref:Uncharacterized protein n=2 Tax=Plesiocystis pacifica TaxID=191768 RepID=A6G0J5_9BACT|nr:hypothetical protein PPSIR1_37149 [Plesiocystis pacifica SIR-1]